MVYYNPYLNPQQYTYPTTTNPYAPIQQPQPAQQPQQVQAKPERHIDRVHGMEGAKQYAMGVNEDIFLLDDTASDIGYFKMTDATGFPTVKAFRLTLIPEKSTKSLEETLSSIADRLDKLEKRSNNNGSNKYSRNAESS